MGTSLWASVSPNKQVELGLGETEIPSRPWSLFAENQEVTSSRNLYGATCVSPFQRGEEDQMIGCWDDWGIVRAPSPGQWAPDHKPLGRAEEWAWGVPEMGHQREGERAS